MSVTVSIICEMCHTKVIDPKLISPLARFRCVSIAYALREIQSTRENDVDISISLSCLFTIIAFNISFKTTALNLEVEIEAELYAKSYGTSQRETERRRSSE